LHQSKIKSVDAVEQLILNQTPVKAIASATALAMYHAIGGNWTGMRTVLGYTKVLGFSAGLHKETGLHTQPAA
jgi:hypothetical protein